MDYFREHLTNLFIRSNEEVNINVLLENDDLKDLSSVEIDIYDPNTDKVET